MSKKFHPGDPVLINWEMLKDVPAVVRKIRSGGDWISVAIKPEDLENRKVERSGFFKISPDGYVHFEVLVSRGEIKHRNGLVNYGRLGEN